MDLRCTNKTNVFADWLSVTCSPDDSFLDSVQYALDSMGGVVSSVDKSVVYRLGSGTIKILKQKTFHGISVSGGALFRMRELRKLDFFLSCISETPHRVTRLDAAIDFGIDGPVVFSHYQKRFARASRYPKLSRKTVEPSYYSSMRPSDGQITGTVYIGDNKSKVSARIYDKQEEARRKRGEELPPTTRFELTIRGDMNPSLRDVSEPTAIFWHYMGKTVLEAPTDAPVWEQGWGGNWDMQVEKPLLYQVVKSKIENNPELLRIFELAESMSPDGRRIAMRMINDMHGDTHLQKTAS